MTGTHKAIASNPKAVARLQKIKADAIKAGMNVSEVESIEMMPTVAKGGAYWRATELTKSEHKFYEYHAGNLVKAPVTESAVLTIILTITGTPVYKTKKAPRNPLYLPFKGPSAVEYVPSDEDLAFFAETASLPDTMQAPMAVAA